MRGRCHRGGSNQNDIFQEGEREREVFVVELTNMIFVSRAEESGGSGVSFCLE